MREKTTRRIPTRLLMMGLAFFLFAGERAQQDSCAQVTSQAGGGQNNPDPLAELNRRFRGAYARARKELLAKQGPVIIADGDSLILLRNGRRTEVSVTAMADIVKPVGHTPLAIYAVLVSAGEPELTEECLQELRRVRDLIEPAMKALADRGLPEDILALQKQILGGSARFVDGVLASKKATSEARAAFARKLGPLLRASLNYAAATQLDAMHRQIRAWKADMTAAEWRQLRILIPGSALPRKDNLRTQYFARLLGENGEGERILYAEALFDEARALNLLGSFQLDSIIGSDFFDDSSSMRRDLLADGATAHIKKMNFDP